MAKCRSSLTPYPIYTTVLTGKNIPLNVGYRPKIPECVIDMLNDIPKPQTPPGTFKQKLIQTMFRDSEAQTDPYSVDVAETASTGLEILTLGWLSWNNGLPAGINEVRTIERARQRRAWEAALPAPFDKTTEEIRNSMIRAIEINEWQFREELIAATASLREELAQKLMREKCRENKLRYEDRLNKYVQKKKEEKFQKIEKLKKNFNRQLRKLIFNRQKLNKKYQKWDAISKFTDKTSDLYAPQLRFGENPSNWHEKIAPRCGFWRAFKKLEIMHFTTSDIPTSLLPAFDFQKKSKPKEYGKDLCIHYTKWTEKNLERLHEELKAIRWKRISAPEQCSLKKKIQVHGHESYTPTVTPIPDEEEELFQACLFLQKTIKGRAIQAVMFEGRVKCQELIEELKSTHALQSHMEDIKGQMRKRVYGLQRQAEIERIQEKKKNEILFALEGKTTGDMLDFLSKELLRLQNERNTHALALLAEQERHKREAVEAGRRQKEEQRRREHDEMFKQIIKMCQNTVQVFMDEAFIENKNWLALREAREQVTAIAKKIDQAANETTLIPMLQRSNMVEEEEIIADLIHNYALPEAEKIMIRKRLQDKQRNYLKICHDVVYSNIEKLVEGKRTKAGELLPLARIGKHKIPPSVRVKYRRLKRMQESSSSSMETKDSGNSIANEQFLQHQSSKIELQQEQEQQPSNKDIWSSGFSRQEVIIKSDGMSSRDHLNT